MMAASAPDAYGTVRGRGSRHRDPITLDEEQTLVAGGGVGDFIDTFHDCVQGGVVAYGGVGAREVVVLWYRADLCRAN